MIVKLDGDAVEYVVNTVCQEVAELPDRTSPADWPEAMLVTAEELSEICRGVLTDQLTRCAVWEGGR